MTQVTCKWVTGRLPVPTQGLLEHERNAIAAHLEGCVECAQRNALAKQLAAAAPEIQPPQMSPFAEKKMITAALDGRLPNVSEPRSLRTWALAGALAATCVVGALVLLGMPGEPLAPSPAPVAAVAPAEVPAQSPAVVQMAQLPVHNFSDATPVVTRYRDNIWGVTGSSVRVDDTTAITRLALEEGTILVEATHRDEEERLVVETELAQVTVTGTLFSVTNALHGHQTVRVLEGSVDVKVLSTGEVVSLLAQEEFTIGQPSKQAASPESIAADLRLVGQAMAMQPGSVAQAGKVKKPSAARPDHAALASEAIKEKRLAEAAQQIDRARDSAGAKDVPDLLGRLARAYRQQQKFSLARQTYQRLIAEYPQTNAATNAMVALAQLQLNVLGEKESALARFDEYLQVAPTGYLAEEAAVGRVRALVSLGRNSAARNAANTFLQQHTGSAYKSEMLLHRADADARAGNCAAARVDYAAIAKGWPGSKVAARAERGLAACTQQ